MSCSENWRLGCRSEDDYPTNKSQEYNPPICSLALVVRIQQTVQYDLNKAKSYQRTATHFPSISSAPQPSQSQLSASNAAKSPKPSSSTSSNPPTSVQSTSIIATTYIHPSAQPLNQSSAKTYPSQLTSPHFPPKTGTTISLLLSPSQAICPGNSRTSATLNIFFSAAAVPHTPLPMAMLWHAGRPWNGPRSRVLGSERWTV